ncbi:hypothetical protein IAD21_05405 [Abditibacteriota bacterium]|nr:hypothetical protein IAD21_05405 [Abditibacteriota bacterium]
MSVRFSFGRNENGVSPICTASQSRRYLAKISGPLLDRITSTSKYYLSSEELMSKRTGESLCAVRRQLYATERSNSVGGVAVMGS